MAINSPDFVTPKVYGHVVLSMHLPGAGSGEDTPCLRWWPLAYQEWPIHRTPMSIVSLAFFFASNSSAFFWSALNSLIIASLDKSVQTRTSSKPKVSRKSFSASLPFLIAFFQTKLFPLCYTVVFTMIRHAFLLTILCWKNSFTGLIVLLATISKLTSSPSIWSRTSGKSMESDWWSIRLSKVVIKSLIMYVSLTTPWEGLHPKSRRTFYLTTLVAIVFPLVRGVAFVSSNAYSNALSSSNN